MVGMMKQDESTNPVNIGSLRPQAVVMHPQNIDHAVIEPGLRFPREEPQRLL